MTYKIVRGVRWGLTAVLLFQVWTHSHWSVALSLTLLAILVEIKTA